MSHQSCTLYPCNNIRHLALSRLAKLINNISWPQISVVLFSITLTYCYVLSFVMSMNNKGLKLWFIESDSLLLIPLSSTTDIFVLLFSTLRGSFKGDHFPDCKRIRMEPDVLKYSPIKIWRCLILVIEQHDMTVGHRNANIMLVWSSRW